jgi:hypothetical protein
MAEAEKPLKGGFFIFYEKYFLTGFFCCFIITSGMPWGDTVEVAIRRTRADARQSKTPRHTRLAQRSIAAATIPDDHSFDPTSADLAFQGIPIITSLGGRTLFTRLELLARPFSFG